MQFFSTFREFGISNFDSATKTVSVLLTVHHGGILSILSNFGIFREFSGNRIIPGWRVEEGVGGGGGMMGGGLQLKYIYFQNFSNSPILISGLRKNYNTPKH
jgi:hypothetical protein